MQTNTRIKKQKVGNISILLPYIFTFLLFLGCKTTQKLSTSNLSFIYQPDKNLIQSSFRLFHKDAVSTELHFSLNSNNLLYAKKETDDFFISRIRVNYQVFQNYSSNQVIDSATTFLTDTNNEKLSKLIFGKMLIKMAYPANYILKIKVTDVFRNTSEEKILRVNKSDFTNGQNFFIADPENNLPYLSPFFKPGQQVKISYSYRKIDKLHVEYFNRNFNLPAPPFSNANTTSFDYRPDSSYILNVSDSVNTILNINRNGFYFLKTVKSSNSGLTLFGFDESFPKIKSHNDMVEPMRYISTNREFEEVVGSSDIKSAINSFWLSLAQGNQNTAKVLIKNYYHRVEEANLYFSSYLPGWKTDRGMIFIVFGKPKVIYKDDITETWIYGEENTPFSVSFYFTKVRNQFSENDYRLTRSPVLKNPWYAAVDQWRKGKITDQY